MNEKFSDNFICITDFNANHKLKTCFYINANLLQVYFQKQKFRFSHLTIQEVTCEFILFAYFNLVRNIVLCILKLHFNQKRMFMNPTPFLVKT